MLVYIGLDWFTSYLSDRCQQLKIQNYTYDAIYISFGIPQGSVLGSILFTLYTAPLSQVITEHYVEHHLYVDDTQIYICISGCEAFATDVFTSMTNTKLQLNPSKADFVIIGPKKQREKLKDLFPILLLDHATLPKAFIRNLGLIFYSNDKSLRLAKSASITSVTYVQKYLSPEAAKSAVCALVNSHFDYYNSLLYNLPDKDIDRLQWVQNCLARVVCKAACFS